MNKYFLVIIVSLFVINCSPNSETPYVKSIKDFHSRRIERLKQPNGWLSLTGLFWLKEGENTFGSAKTNDLVFSNGSAPDHIGSFDLKNSVVTVKIREDLEVFDNDSLVSTKILLDDISGTPTILKLGSLSWYVIKRGDKYGIRLKDSESKLLKEFTDIEMFDIDSTWRVEGKFVKYAKPKDVEVPNVLGTVDTGITFGKLTFRINSQEFSLEPLGDEESLFLIFGDMTNGEETYGAGRFLSVDAPDSTGVIYIDFNKSYNPPCVFTKYATCPLPTEENYLKIKITAGEMNFHSAYH